MGKSSVFDAIQWCLTGNVERFKNVSSARHHEKCTNK